MRRRIPIYGKAVLVFLVALFVFLVVVPLVSAPIPGQLFGWYVVTTVVVILLYVSSTEAFWEEFATPIRRLLLARTAITKPLRVVVFIGLPLLLGWYFSTWVSGSAEPPGGLRVIHPSPPASIDVKGRRLNLKEVAGNPPRAGTTHPAVDQEQGRQAY